MTIPTLKIQKTSQPPDSSKLTGNEGGGTDATTQFSVDPTTEVKDLEAEVKGLQSELDDKFFLDLSIQAFTTSDQYFRDNIRPRLDNSIRTYHNQHTANSIIGFDGDMSNVYRPKTRTVINNYKAAAAASFFSNLDVVSIEPENPSDKIEVINANIMKSLLNYRLKKTIPWYQLCIGAFDDSMTNGMCVGYLEWEHTEKLSGRVIDRPVVTIVPLENLRFDPNADWENIVDSTPYIILLQPMYIGDLKAAMKSGKYKQLEDDEIASSIIEQNTTAKERAPNNVDPATESKKQAVNDYQTVVVQLHIHRIEGEDFVWSTLNNTEMLSEPQLLSDVYPADKRPFIIGSSDIEPHTNYVTPFPELLANLQEEMNVLANQRRTNVDMALNRKWRVDPEAGDQFDAKALTDNATGAVVFAPAHSIEALDVPDVTQSSYMEMQQMDQDFNSLAGNFNPNQNLAAKAPGDSAYRTQQMLNSQASIIVDGRLKCFALTFVEPLLRHLCLLEQHFETDDVIVALAGMQSGMFIKEGKTVGWSDDVKHMLGTPTQEFMNDHFNELLKQNQQANNPPQQPPQGAGTPPPAAPGAAPPQGSPPAPGQSPAPGELNAGMFQTGGAPTPPEQPKSTNLPPGVNIRDLLAKELVINVNVGLNATSPDLKLQRFQAALGQSLAFARDPAHMQFDMTEVFKETFALAGYGDGKRFMANSDNPEVNQLRQQVMQLSMRIKQQTDKTQMSEKNKAGIAAGNNQSREKIAAANIKLHRDALKQKALIAILEHSRNMHALDSAVENTNDEVPTE